MNGKVKEHLVFWATVIAICVTAWAFWHYLGHDADTVLLIVVVVGLMLENRRLRMRL